jgi:hypothetical protein
MLAFSSRGEIQALFDTQIRVIVKAINKQLEWMSMNKVGQEVVSRICHYA